MTNTPVTDAAQLTEAAIEWVSDVHALSGQARIDAIDNAKKLCETAQAVLAELPKQAYGETLQKHVELAKPLFDGLDGKERFLWRVLQRLIPSRHTLALRAERDIVIKQPSRASA